MSVMSQYRRNRSKKKPSKNRITKKDKIIGILAIVLLVIIAAALAVYVAFSNAHLL